MNQDLEILFTVKKKSYFIRLLGNSYVFYFIVIIAIFCNPYILKGAPFRTSESTIISVLVFLLFIFLPLLLSSNLGRYQITEIGFNDKLISIRYMDKYKECIVNIELTDLRMTLGGIGEFYIAYKLDFYDRNTKKLHQMQGFGWSKDMLIVVYKKFEKYNKYNTSFIML